MPELYDALNARTRTRKSYFREVEKIKPRRVEQYKDYLKRVAVVNEQRAAAYKEFEELVLTLYFVLPIEITGAILEWYAKANAPSTQPWAGLPRVAHQAAVLRYPLEAAAERWYRQREPDEEHWISGPNGLTFEKAMFLGQAKAEAAVFKNTIWRETSTRTALLPDIAAWLGCWTRMISHLDLTVHVPLRAGRDCYARNLFALQDALPKLRTTKVLPCLRSLLIEVTVPRIIEAKWRVPGLLRGRSWAEPSTSMAAELEKLVQGMRGLAVRERYLHYHALRPDLPVGEEDGRATSAEIVAGKAVERQCVIRV
ncbi:hypothetical protein LTR36_004828 [Oleoguttula mirabilis]|uniref:Uncharacterized protein n=1 Tax=Oleoguttula mirabilis TaxID=1507867 RepID=A0AAV9JEY5_9PEZI|nr:hypothetical protein LTR36_004828 [Oleoguttula mirabilis]